MPQKGPTEPFRYNTRQRIQKISTRAYAAGTTLEPITIPQVGYLANIVIQFRGTITLSGAGALTDKGPWNLLNKLTLASNQGAANLVDLTGYGAFVSHFWLNEGSASNRAGIGDTVPSADYFAAPVAGGANVWALTYYIPVSANDGRNFEIGLINLQAPEVRLQLNLTCGALLDPSTLVTATTGTFHIFYEFYEAPNPALVLQPPAMVVRTLEDVVPIVAVGDLTYQIPRQGTLLQLASYITLNAARSDSIDNFAMRVNKTDSVYSIERQLFKWQQRMRYLCELPVGVYHWDFWNAEKEVSQGDTRDALDTEAVTTMDFITTINSGATLGAGTNFQNNIRRIVQQVG
jgi:hypothetical protein